MNQENINVQIENVRPNLFSKLRKWMARLAIASLLFSNFATLVDAKVHDFLYSGVEKASDLFGVDKPFPSSPTNVKNKKFSAKNKKLTIENEKLKKASTRATEKFNKISKKAKTVRTAVAGRLAKSISLNLEALPVMVIPAIGTATSIAVVGVEIYLACESMKDMNSLLVMLGGEEEGDDVCGQKLPTSDEVLDKTKKGASAVVTDMKDALDGVLKGAENVPGNAASAAKATIDVAIESYDSFETSATTVAMTIYEALLDGLGKVASFTR